jgi:4-carboxymuconolactone decarboxylase
MNDLDPCEHALVALGAALGSNCIPCVEHHLRAAQQAGIGNPRIAAAVALADRVRQVPAGKTLDAAQRLLPGLAELPASPAAADDGAGAPEAAASRGVSCCGRRC